MARIGRRGRREGVRSGCMRRRDEGQSKHRMVVLLGEADMRGRGILGGLEGAGKGRKGHFEVDDVGGGGLDCVRGENGVLGMV